MTAAFRRRSRLVSSTACSVLALVLATGCGGGGSAQTTAQRPVLPAGLAQDLADDADLVAARLDAGDPAGAKRLADELARSVDDAIAAGQVPRPFRAELRAAVARLIASVAEAAIPPPTTGEDEDEHEGKPKGEDEKGHEGHGKHEKGPKKS